MQSSSSTSYSNNSTLSFHNLHQNWWITNGSWTTKEDRRQVGGVGSKGGGGHAIIIESQSYSPTLRTTKAKMTTSKNDSATIKQASILRSHSKPFTNVRIQHQWTNSPFANIGKCNNIWGYHDDLRPDKLQSIGKTKDGPIGTYTTTFF